MSGAAERGKLGGVVRDFLDGLPPAVAETVRAAAVPHAFDAQVLAAMLDMEAAEAERACGTLREMPFVQAMGDRRYALHEMVRDFLLDELWRERREDYRAWSRRAAEHFEGDDQDASRLEAAYHWLVAEPERGADLVWNWGAEWNNTFQYEWVESLVQLGLEHEGAGRLGGRARGWILFRKGQTHVRYSENREALASLEAGLEAGRGDRQLEANCIQALGDVHRMVAEYGAARERYEEALPLYRAIGARLGEANCIQALGDVHRMVDEYGAARERYEEALGMYESFFPADHRDVKEVRKKLEEVERERGKGE